MGGALLFPRLCQKSGTVHDFATGLGCIDREDRQVAGWGKGCDSDMPLRQPCFGVSVLVVFLLTLPT